MSLFLVSHGALATGRDACTVAEFIGAFYALNTRAHTHTHRMSQIYGNLNESRVWGTRNLTHSIVRISIINSTK